MEKKGLISSVEREIYEKHDQYIPCPNGLYIHSFGDVHDQLNVGVVVVVRSAWYRHIVIGHLNVLSVRLQIFWCDHHHKSNRTLISEHLVSPSPDGSHAFHGGDAIVGDQHFVDHFGAFETLDELFRSGK